MNGDQFFNATFTPNGGLTEFPPFPPSRPKASRSPLGGAIAANSGQSNGSNGVGTPQQLSPGNTAGMDGLPDQLAGMNISPHKQMHNLSNQGVAAFQGRNPRATEFVPRSNSPAGVTNSNSILNHSASTPAFHTYAQHAAAGLHATGMSPMGGSPAGLSPANSPMVGRRPPHQTTSSPTPAYASPTPSYAAAIAQQTPQQHPQQQPPPMSAAAAVETVGGTTYFYSNDDIINNGTVAPEPVVPQPVIWPNFTMYPGVLPHVAHMKPQSHLPSFFMSDDLKSELLNRQVISMARVDHDTAPDIPQELDNYQNLFPLESIPSNPMHKSTTFGYPTSVYRATNVKDGINYCLRRVHGFRLVQTKCMAMIDNWKKIQHANIVSLREVFTTKAFGDHSIVFVYDFHPGAETMMQQHFSQSHQQHNMNGYSNPYNLDGAPRPYSAGKSKGRVGASTQQLLPESQLWSYIVQLSSALRTIHAHGLSCRVVDPTKLLITDKNRLRLNCVGIFDVIHEQQNNMDPQAMMSHYQQDDLAYMGKVLLSLACGSLRAFQQEHLSTSLDLVQRNYSADVKNLFVYLFMTTRARSVNDIMPMIGARFYSQLEATQLRCDMLTNELSKEVENSRLLRLVTKLNTINDRPEFRLDPAWSETGDRYMLSLFRDYLYHQVDENGQPWIDMAHIITQLNKLDAGLPEKVMLMSRDEQNILIVTYQELKRCVEAAFSELVTTSSAASAATIH